MSNVVYLVINEWSSGNDTGNDIKVFKNYKDAINHFEKVKRNTKTFGLNYDCVIDKDDYYCENVTGDYNNYHELVYILQKPLL